MRRRTFFLRSSTLSLAALGTSHLALSQTICTTSPLPAPGPVAGPVPAPAPAVAPAPAPAPSGGIDAVAQIKALRIPTGPYAGAYEIAPNGKANWYFTQLGLLPIVQFLSKPELETYIRSYLDLYLRSCSAACFVDDVDFPYGRTNTSSFVTVKSDSDDSYAATLLSLAVRYVRASQNWAWWEANKAKLKEIAYRNLAVPAKVSGLTSTFQPQRSQTNSLGYLMDNCEVYRGLRDFAGLLRERSETQDANYYDSFATGAASGMARLFDTSQAAFACADMGVPITTSFYPGTTCQVFPQAFGVTEMAPLYDRGWAYLSKHSAGWEDGRYDPYSWAVLGFVAAKRGLMAQARAQMASIEKKFVTNRGLVTINELGFYQRTKSVLAGGVDV